MGASKVPGFGWESFSRLTLGRKLALLVSVVAALALGGLAIYLIRAEAARYAVDVQRRLDLAHASLTGLLEASVRGYERQASDMAGNPEIQRLFGTAARELDDVYRRHQGVERQAGKALPITDPESLRRIEGNESWARLRDLTAPVYQEQSKLYRLGQFQFHLPPARSFFRVQTSQLRNGVYSTGTLGDDLSAFRTTVLAANGALSGYPQPARVAGLEIGRGGPGLRGVVPVSFEGRHVGTVEFGGGIEDVLREAASRTGMSVSVFLSKKIVEEIAWDFGAKVLREQKGGKHGDYLLFDAADVKLAELLTGEAVAPGAGGSPQVTEVEQDGKSWRHASYELTDFAKKPIGSVVISFDESESVAALRRSSLGIGAAMLVLIVLIAGVTTLGLRRLVVQPVDGIAEAMKRVGAGEYAARCPVESQDEMGFVATQINTTLDRVIELIQSEEEKRRLQGDIQDLLVVVANAADGDFKGQAKVTETIIGNVGDAVNLMFENVRDVVTKIRDSAIRIASSATQMQASAERLEGGSTRQVEDITSTTAAVREMVANIDQVANNAEATADAAERSRKSAAEGRERARIVVEGMEGIRRDVQTTLRQVKRLGDRSMEISGIVETISKIAGQTDMLALNAAIEAARAGEHGRGFSVVAEEVRRLAERTSDATREIKDLVLAIQTETTEAVRAMDAVTGDVESQVRYVNEAEGSLARIADLSNQAAELVQEITLASKQQVRGAEEVARAMGQVSEVSQQALGEAAQTRHTTAGLVTLAGELTTAVSEFRV